MWNCRHCYSDAVTLNVTKHLCQWYQSRRVVRYCTAMLRVPPSQNQWIINGQFGKPVACIMLTNICSRRRPVPPSTILHNVASAYEKRARACLDYCSVETQYLWSFECPEVKSTPFPLLAWLVIFSLFPPSLWKNMGTLCRTSTASLSFKTPRNLFSSRSALH